MDLTRIRKNATDFGWPRAMEGVACDALNRAIFFRILQCIEISSVDPAYLKLDPKLTHGFLDEAAIRRYSAVPEYDLRPAFLDQALANGDRCYGILDGDRLASFGWYSTRPTQFSEDFQFTFGDRHVYMYKGFTHSDYRGQRLHAIGMTWALKDYLEKGYRGIISYVFSNNFDSLRSCYRMGYTDVGRIYLAQRGRRHWVYADRGCRRFGASLEPISPG